MTENKELLNQHHSNDEGPERMKENRPFHRKRAFLFPLLIVLLPLIVHYKAIFARSFLWDDFLNLYYPQHNFAANQLLQKCIPFWNPYVFGGTPFIGDIQSAIF